jgi:hypothetical protein
LEEIEGECSEAIRDRVKSELHPGERLLWTSGALASRASPALGVIITRLVTLGLFSHALAALWMISRDPWGNWGPFIGTGIMSAVACLVFSLGLFAGWQSRRYERKRASETLYALTDHRAIIWRPSHRRGGVEIHSILRGTFAKIHRIEYEDGRGDVIFSYSRLGDDEIVVWGPLGFEGIAEVRRVEDLLRSTLLTPGEPALE